MIGYFPIQYPDEVLYSIIARYHNHILSSGWKETLNILYNIRTVSATVDLPSHLKSLSFNIRIPYESLIYDYTMFPVYSFFVDNNRKNHLLYSMINTYGGNIHTRSGLVASKVKMPIYLRYCPKCYLEDLDTVGESYWRRLFQIPGVEVCLKHRLPLNQSCVNYTPLQKHEFLAADNETCINMLSLPYNRQIVEMYTRFVLYFYQILNRQVNFDFSYSSIGQIYKKYLFKQGYLLGENRINWDSLYNNFSNYYSDYSILEKYNLEISRSLDSCWLKTILRKQRKVFHPLMHVLVINFFQKDSTPVMSNFLSIKTKKYYFKKKISKVKSYDEINAKRNEWVSLLNKVNLDSVDNIRKLQPGLYTWLFRYDKDWFKKNIPIRKRKQFINNRVDWSERDLLILSELKIAYNNIIEGGVYPRITTSLLAKKINRKSIIEKKINKLTKCKNFIDGVIEDIVHYQKRRVLAVYHTLRIDKGVVKEWEIYRKAGLRKNIDLEVKNFILNLIEGSSSLKCQVSA